MRKKLLMPIGIIYLCTLGFSAWKQCGYWKNNMELFSHALNVTENNDLMHYNIAWVYIQRGDFKSAKTHLREALRINPHDDNIYTNLGAICMHEGDKEKAAHYYNEGLKLNPLNQTLHYNRGIIYAMIDNFSAAQKHFQMVLLISPDYDLAKQALSRLPR